MVVRRDVFRNGILFWKYIRGEEVIKVLGGLVCSVIVLKVGLVCWVFLRVGFFLFEVIRVVLINLGFG